MLLPPEIVDAVPATDEERARLMIALVHQARETSHLLNANSNLVTCPCGAKVCIILAFHCYHCGLWLCRACSERHFGPAVPQDRIHAPVALRLRALLDELQAANKMAEPEGHMHADEALLRFIDSREVTAAYEGLTRWYE